MRCEGIATAVLKKVLESRIHLTKLKQVVNVGFNLRLGLQVSHLHEWAYIYENRICAAFGKVIGYETGIWFIRLFSRHSMSVDHFLLLEAQQGIIIDPVEPFALHATVGITRD